MQRMDSLDSANNKIVFKKQKHRPWNTKIQEETKILLKRDSQLNPFDNDRLLIGGFSFPKTSKIAYESEQNQNSIGIMDELKSKELEIEALSTHLKIASALEHAEQIELSRKKETLARKIAEEKVLNTTQKLNLTEDALQKTKQQLQIEQQLKSKEESIRKSLETEIKNVLIAIEENENTIARETKARQVVEEKLNETLNLLTEKENHVRLEAEKAIRDHLRDAVVREKNIKETLEARISNLQNEHKERTLKIQCQAELRIAEAEEKIQHHEDAKIKAEQCLQESREATRQIEIQKTAIENNLKTIIQNTTNQKSQYESIINSLRLHVGKLDEKISSMDSENVALKQQLFESLSKLNTTQQTESNAIKSMDSLNLQIQQLTEKHMALQNEKAQLTAQFTDTLGKSKILQSIVSNERRLRTILEEKLIGSTLRKTEIDKKLFETKIIELTEKISLLEVEKAQYQEDQNNAFERAQKIEILMNAEKSIKKSLQEKNKTLMEQLHLLEHVKQKETDEKNAAHYKISELVSKKQHLEMEKALIEEKHNKTLLHTSQLEVKFDYEKSISTNLEKKLTILTKQQEALAQEKESIEEKFHALFTRSNELELILNNEKNTRMNLDKKVEILLEQKLALEQEKTSIQEAHHKLLTKAAELEIMLESEKTLRKDAERLQMIEESNRKAAQEKISSAMKQANQTVLNVLGSYTTTDVSND